MFCGRDTLGLSIPSQCLLQPVQRLMSWCHGHPTPLPSLSLLQGVQEHRGAEDKNYFRHHCSPWAPCRKGQKGA